MAQKLPPTIAQMAESPDEEKRINEIQLSFNRLSFDAKLSLINALKDAVNTERKNSIHFDLEEDYLTDIARRESILQSVEHVADALPKYVIIMIVVSTISSSVMLPFLKMLHTTNPFLRAAWRSIIFVLCFVPMMIWEIKKYGEGVKKLFSLKNVLMIFLCQIFGSLSFFMTLIALSYTYSSHVLLFSGMVPIVLLFWKIMKRLPITTYEIMGIIIAIFGSMILAKSGGSSGEYTPHSIMIGDLISFLGAVFGAFNLQILAPLLQVYRSGIYSVISNTCVYLLSILAMTLSPEPFSLGFDPLTGLFGFLHPSNWLICFGAIGVIGGYGFLFCFLISMKYLSPLLMSLTCLVQPFLAQIFSTAIGLEGFPGIMSIVGGVIVLMGLFFVAKSSPIVKRKSSMRKASGLNENLMSEMK